MKYILISLSLIILLSGCANTSTDFKAVCENSGGVYNTCSSPCLGTDADVCAQVCITACECLKENDYSCPEGFVCQYQQGQSRGRCIEQ